MYLLTHSLNTLFTPSQKAESLKEEITSHWHPNMTINLVHDFTQWTRGAVPPPLDEFVEFTPAGDRYVCVCVLYAFENHIQYVVE